MPLTDPLSAAARRRLRLLTWRARRPVAALCAGLAALLAVGLVRPADPPSARVPVAARDLAVGTVLAPGDVRLAEVPVALLPSALADEWSATGSEADASAAADGRAGDDGADAAGATVDGASDAGSTRSSAVTALTGRRLAVAVPAGLPLVAELLVDDAATGPSGTVVVPVRFADAGVADVLVPGMRVDVVAAALHDGDEATRLARAAVVLARPGGDDPGPGTGGGLLGGGATSTESTPVLLAVDPDESVALSGAAASRVLSAVIVG
ncbi:SAF domain-containing protein [Cellulomonas sp. PS-H5]|uniref:SAF domain-containing protein n=1 Tax=Cellulomonas sp. PS-H5 TaxID=2820400 RepID=UPI0027E3465C|nr:SAF domain-containing protein [Cellulomonas sp. PS-H5]